MGFSVSGATVIVFIGILVSAAAFYPAIDRFTERRSDAIDAREERSLDRQNTAVSVSSATATGTPSTLTVTVENDGASTLAVSRVTLLVDGEYVTPDDTTVEGDATTDVWASGETLTLTVEDTTGSRVKVVTGPGVATTAEVG